MKEENKAPIEGAIQNLIPAASASISILLSALGLPVSPIQTIALQATLGLYGYWLYYKHDEFNQFVIWIKNHPNEFTKHIVEQPAFQEGILPTIEAFLHARSKEKVELVKAVFLGFADHEHKDRFDLERFYSTIQNISYEALEYLGFIRRTIVPLIEQKIEEESTKRASQTPKEEGGESKETWKVLLRRTETVTKYTKEWIHEEFHPDGKRLKNRIDFDTTDRIMVRDAFAAMSPHVDRLTEMTAEYLSLGFFEAREGSQTLGGGTPTEHTFTDFGWKFMSFLEISNSTPS